MIFTVINIYLMMLGLCHPAKTGMVGRPLKNWRVKKLLLQIFLLYNCKKSVRIVTGFP